MEQLRLFGAEYEVHPVQWRDFAERRRQELANEYPGALPCGEACCPRHGVALGVVTMMCLLCHNALFEQIAREYAAAQREPDSKLRPRA